MEKTKQSGVEFSNSDAVVELNVMVLGTNGIKLCDVHLRDTIADIKERVCDEVTEKFGKTYACEPDVFMMILFPSFKVFDDDLSKDLFDVLTEAGIIIKDVDRYPHTVVVQLYPAGFVIGASKEEEDEDEDRRMDLYYHEGMLDDDDSEENDVEEPEPEPEDAFSVKRPDGCILPDNMGTFRVFGKILAHRLTNHGEKRRYIPYEGLTYPLEQVTKMTISASLVLLVFNSENLAVLREFIVDTCATSTMIILQVSWDKFSYLFLRKLRQNLCPSVPIVAVTDMDVRHLDLLAFLDTPPCDLPRLYHWNLSQDCAEVGVQDSELVVDIKWLGIRPSDMDDASSADSSCFANASSNLPLDFSKVYDFLSTHPHLSNKNKWVEELRIIADRRLHRSLPYLWQGMHYDTNCKFYVWKKYLPMKIRNEDWI